MTRAYASIDRVIGLKKQDYSLMTKEQLAAMIELLTQIIADSPPAPIKLQWIVDLACQLTFASGAVVEMLDGEDMVYVGVTQNLEQNRGLRLNANTSLSGLCVTTGEILVCSDAENDSRVDKHACLKVGLKSMMVAPLIRDAKTIGVIKVLSPNPQAFDDIDKQVLTMSSRIIGLTLPELSSAMA